MKFIIKLSAEITIKTKPVRKRFVRQLHTNIQRVLRHRQLSADVIIGWDMLEVVSVQGQHDTDGAFMLRGERIAQALSEIPGIAHFLVVDEFALKLLKTQPAEQQDATPSASEEILEAIAKYAAVIYSAQLPNKSFVVRCKRSGQHPFTSHEVERFVGAYLLRQADNASVKMRGADVTVSLEIKNKRLFVVRARHSGIGGYPIGCVGPVLSLISGGFDSAVASYDVIRRGMDTHYLFFNLGGHAHEAGVTQMAHYLWERYSASQRVAFISVPFEAVVEEILENVANPYMGVILKRMMMRAASRVAQSMNISALVTGESVAQVSSQTLENLAIIDKASEALVLRPLVSADKREIIATATAIGAAGYAEKIPEYCAVISDKPTTHAKLDRVIAEEQLFNFDVLDKAIESRKATAIDKVYKSDAIYEEVATQAIPTPAQIVIDLRHDEECEKHPLVLHSNQTLHIPAYKINAAFESLDADKEYLLYCDRGVMSKIHAAHLIAEGHRNVKIYQPEQ
jgi:thiamine biosynthesis protein ThiI